MDRRILVLGAGGLVGTAVASRFRPGLEIVGLERSDLDVTCADEVVGVLENFSPIAVVNAAAQARVDLADQEPDRTRAVNSEAPARLALLCRERNIRLVHLSTDYVLDGQGRGLLNESLSPSPRSEYAHSKLLGEQAALAQGATVARVQWVYRPGHPGFFTRTLEALARGEEVSLVTDQVGCPTPATVVAEALIDMASSGPVGLFHVACAGEATAWDWIGQAAMLLGLPLHAREILRADLKGAWRPGRSCLDASLFVRTWGRVLPGWQAALAVALGDTRVVDGRLSWGVG
ncbi:MAG: NAD(P)-dependent oxidoreductase [Myxococcota bacterium]|nr:NAD(P)-dependent oxidoreductase [Myxococcota bacterium]